MRFVIYGAGGIGGVLGARLHQSGRDVLLIARGAHFEAIRNNGLRLQSAEEDITLDVPVVDHPSAVDWRDDDVIFMAMKSQDTLAALYALAETAPSTVAVVSLQNGVANERQILRFFPKVYGICVMCPTNYLTPGVVQAYSSPVTGIFDVGRFPDGVDDTVRLVSEAFNASTYISEQRPDIMRWKYGKLLMNLGNGIDALCGPVARDTDLYKIVREEGVRVLRAAGIDFVDADEDLERRGEIMRIRPIEGQRRGGGSTWQSLERGLRTVETDYLNGEIVLLSRLHGVPAPLNELMQRLTVQGARDGVAAGSVPPDEIVKQLG